MATKTFRDVLEQAATWPREDQEELAEYAREIEARRTGIYSMSDDERIAVGRGLAEADRADRFRRRCFSEWRNKCWNICIPPMMWSCRGVGNC